MPDSGRIVGLTRTRNQMLRARRGEGCSVIYELVASFKVEKRKISVGDAWFRVSPLSLSLSVGVLVCGLSYAFFWDAPLSRNLSFISFFSFDRIRLGFLWIFFFLMLRPRIGQNIIFNRFYFLTNFIDISLCADHIYQPLRSGRIWHKVNF